MPEQSERRYEEVRLPGARRTTRVLVDAGNNPDGDVSQVPVGAFASVEAQRTESAMSASEAGGGEGREYEEVLLPNSKRTTRVLRKVGDADMEGGVARMTAGVESAASADLGEDRRYETIKAAGSERETRVLVSTGDEEQTDLTRRIVENLGASQVNVREPRGRVANAYTSTVGQTDEDTPSGTEGRVEIYESPEAAAEAARQEAEEAGIQNADAVMHSAEAGYGTGSGAEAGGAQETSDEPSQAGGEEQKARSAESEGGEQAAEAPQAEATPPAEDESDTQKRGRRGRKSASESE